GQRGLPFGMVDADPTPGIACVNIDAEAGAYAAMTYALRRGHRQIAIFGIRSGHHGDYHKYAGTLQRRIAGYARALADYGLSLSDSNVRLFECECDAEGGREGLQALWQSRWQPTAIVAMADVIAIGVMQAASALGLRIPDDLSVIGYDDIEASSLTCPTLTTVHQPTLEKGHVAARLLLQRIEVAALQAEHVVLPVELVER